MRSPGPGIGGRRLAVVRGALLVVFAVLAARAAHLSVFDERGTKRAAQQTERTLTLPPERGTIVDHSGTELALSLDAPSVFAEPARIRDPAAVARRLAPVLGVKPHTLQKRLAGDRSFAFVSRWVTDDQARRIEALDVDGIGVLREPRRVYPHATLGARVLGFVNIDGKGVRGIEQLENDWLRGQPRALSAERDARGRLLVRTDERSLDTGGGDVALALDAKLQADAEAALAAAVKRTGAEGGFVITMEPSTGSLMAVAEAPVFDPNRFRELAYAGTRSRAFLDSTEPGSTLKVFLVAAALERGTLKADDTIDCENGAFRVPGKTITDHHPHQRLRPAEVLQVSSNIGAVKIAFDLGPASHFEMLRRFGFGESSHSRFPDESSGVLRPWESWQPLDHATIAFGQGVNVTAIQLASALAAVANGGRLMRPRLVVGRRTSGGSWVQEPPQEVRRVLRPDTSRSVMRMLEDVVTAEGTGSQAGLAGVRVAGKTGTAQQLDPDTKRYSNNRFTAWFIGAVPADDPKLVIVAGLDAPQRPLHTGGAAAAPLFAAVAAAQLGHFGIATRPEPIAPAPIAPEGGLLLASAPVLPPVAAPPRAPKAPAPAPTAPEAPDPDPAPVLAAGSVSTPQPVATTRPLPEVVQLGGTSLLPDFTGLSIAEVRQITASATVDVEIVGSGIAVAQEPSPGTLLRRTGASVRVWFRHPGAKAGTEG